MAETSIIWYILFDNYEQGLSLHALLDENGHPNRISPAPRVLKEAAACGMALIIKDDDIAKVRKCIEINSGEYRAIVSFKEGLKSRRDKYC